MTTARQMMMACLALLLTGAAAGGATGKATIKGALRNVVQGRSRALRHAAAPSEDQTSQALLALDVNKDGMVSPAEVESFAKSQGLAVADVRAEFADLDLNGDGTLDSEELATALGDELPTAAKAAPAAKLAPAAKAKATRSLEDAQVHLKSRATTAAYQQARLEGPSRFFDKPSHEPASIVVKAKPVEAAPASQADAQAVKAIRTLDKNNDGSISPDEVVAFAQAQGLDASSVRREFSGYDTNGDGVLSNAELEDALGGEAPAKSDAAAKVEPLAAPKAALEAAPEAAPEAASKAPEDMTFKASPEPATVLAEKGLVTAAFKSKVASHVAQAVLTRASMSAPAAEAKSEVDMAVDAAAGVATQLALAEEKEAQARDLERAAAEIRANLTAIAERAAQQAHEAGRKAAMAASQQVLARIEKVSDKAREADEKAARLHARSQAELSEAHSLMAMADKALQAA